MPLLCREQAGVQIPEFALFEKEIEVEMLNQVRTEEKIFHLLDSDFMNVTSRMNLWMRNNC